MDTTRLHQMRNMPPMKNLRDNYQQVIDEVAEGGLKYLVCSSIPLSTTEEINQGGRNIEQVGRSRKESGHHALLPQSYT